MNLLVTNPTNIRYLTGFIGAVPEEREAYALVTEKKTFLFTNALYIEQAKKLKNINVIQLSRENPVSLELLHLCEKLKIKTLGFEDTNLTVAELTKLKQVLDGVALVPMRDTIERIRQIKKPDEIANIKLATNLTDQCFKFITKRIRPGITESRLALEIEGFIRARGGSLAFTPIVAFSEHASQPHYLERSINPLRRGSLILLDFGTKINGYCADMSRTIFMGPVKTEWKLAYQTVLAAQQKVIDLLAEGERQGATLDAAAQEIIAEAGLPPYPHSLGHCIGLDVHEGPRLSIKKDEKLLPGMVFSVEPGVYLPGNYGIRIEDLVRLTDKGIEILSKSPRGILTV